MACRNQFVSEALRPMGASTDAGAMARGEPALPAAFLWRGVEYPVAAVLKRWRETGPCTSGSGEQYVRRHRFRILTSTGDEWEVYCDRQARRGKNPKARWWLFAITQRPDRAAGR
jgi:hypothetical protein